MGLTFEEKDGEIWTVGLIEKGPVFISSSQLAGLFAFIQRIIDQVPQAFPLETPLSPA